jgi:hypothetical protein
MPENFDILKAIDEAKEIIYKNAFNIQPKVIPKEIFDKMVEEGVIDKEGNFKNEFI